MSFAGGQHDLEHVLAGVRVDGLDACTVHPLANLHR